MRSPAALELDAKICKTLGIRAEYSEGIQAQRYDVGQQFKAHWDYFQPDTDVYRRLAGVRGNRTWTFMVYLNDVPRRRRHAFHQDRLRSRAQGRHGAALEQSQRRWLTQ